MNWLKNYRWKHALAVTFGLCVSSPAWGQLPSVQPTSVPAVSAVPDALNPQPAAPVATIQPGVPVALTNSSTGCGHSAG